MTGISLNKAVALGLGLLVAAAGGATGQPAQGAYPPPTAPAKPNARAFGALLTTNSPIWARLLKQSDRPAALVLAVDPGTEAAAAGLVQGSLIIEVEGRPVSNEEKATTLLRSSQSEPRQIRVLKQTGKTRSALTSGGASSKGSAGPESPLDKYLLARTEIERIHSIVLLEQVLIDVPDFSQGHALLARRYAQAAASSRRGSESFLRRKEKAAAHLNRAIELDPASLTVREIASRAWLELGDFEAAKQQADQALTIDATGGRPNFLLGSALLQLGRDEQALAQAYRSVELSPYASEHYELLISSYGKTGRRDDARATSKSLKALRQSLAAKPKPASEPGSVAVKALAAALLSAGVFVAGHRVRARKSPPESQAP